MARKRLISVSMIAALSLVAAACGSDGDDVADDAASAAPADAPTVAVTTNILGDVVREIAGDQFNVLTIMPVGADPHDFQASAQEVAAVLEADALIVNGENFEEGLIDMIDNATDAGVPVHAAMEPVETIEYGEGGHDHGHDDHEGEEGHDDETHEGHDDEEGHDHEDEEGHDDETHEGHDDEDEEHKDDETHEGHDDEEGHDHEDEEGHDDEDADHKDDETHEGHDDEEGHDHEDEEGHDEEGHDDHEGHDHSGDDPHFFTDPARMAIAVDGIGDFLAAELTGIDAAALEASVDAYVAELETLDAEVEGLVGAIAEDSRVLVTNHEVFGYFADRYDFEVLGTVIPSGSTADGASAGELAELAEVIEAEGVPAIFTDAASPDALAATLADEVGDVAIVELYTESLGDAGSDGATYIDMVRTNAERIAAALG